LTAIFPAFSANTAVGIAVLGIYIIDEAIQWPQVESTRAFSKGAADMLKLLMGRFLDPSSATSFDSPMSGKNPTKVARKRKLLPVR
jgi:hypothetical protein